MAITLPTTVREATATLIYRRFGHDLTPPQGGPVLRINKLGSRFACAFQYPPLTKAQAEPLLAALLRADVDGTTVIAPLPQGPLASSLGSPLVAGAGQTGSTLNADAFTNSVAIPAGSMFNVSIGGRLYLHLTKSAVSANGSGVAALPIAPLLRASPADNAALDFATPKIEGFVEGREIPWSLDEAMHYGLSFTIFENK